MDVKLKKVPKGATIIEGFPGFGLVGTITTEFLINHLDVEEIGAIILKDQQALVALHEGKLIKPITLYYAKKYNLIIIHSIAPGQKKEWDISSIILDIATKSQAKQIISIEGVMSQTPQEQEQSVFYYTNENKFKSSLEKHDLKELKEGIIVGVTAAMLAQNQHKFISLLAETASQLPDSRAAANVILSLDKYLGLKVDPEPLLHQAELFEAKVKGLVQKSSEVSQLQKEKQISYVG